MYLGNRKLLGVLGSIKYHLIIQIERVEVEKKYFIELGADHEWTVSIFQLIPSISIVFHHTKLIEPLMTSINPRSFIQTDGQEFKVFSLMDE